MALTTQKLSELSIEAIKGNFACSICQDFVNEPMVIKHCLHFFCKECIDKNVLNYKKECPLCKVQLRTKRESRFYDKLRKIMNFLKPQIEKENENESTDFKSLMIRQQQHMQELKIR